MPELDIRGQLLKTWMAIPFDERERRVKEYMTSNGITIPGYLDEHDGQFKKTMLNTVFLSEDDNDYQTTICNFQYSDPVTSETVEIAHEQEFEYDVTKDKEHSGNVSTTFTYSANESRSLQYKFTEGLKLGAKAKFEAKAPFVGTEIEVSAEVSFSADQTITNTTTETWTYSTQITVPSGTKALVEAVINVAHVEAAFTCTAQVDGGSLGIGFYIAEPVPGKMPYLQQFWCPVTELMQEQERSLTLSGSFGGGAGVSQDTRVRFEPLAS